MLYKCIKSDINVGYIKNNIYNIDFSFFLINSEITYFKIYELDNAIIPKNIINKHFIKLLDDRKRKICKIKHGK